MYGLVYLKFANHPELLKQLLATGDEELVEGNGWGDRFWGKVDDIGENNLGKILMGVRRELGENHGADRIGSDDSVFGG
jgi:predicted NAD-dependent protein-ADP-ribosyltransferase YbiA (DUF1768 family)